MSRWADWMSTPQYLAQISHFLAGNLLVALAALFFGFAPMFTALAIGFVVAALKEFVYDTATWGEGDSWADSLMDFAFYALGGMTGVGLAALAHYLGRC